MSQSLIKPKIVAFEVTRRCPLHCRHCRAGTADQKDLLSTDDCKKILKSLADYNQCMLIVTGGEPLEREGLLEIIKQGDELGLRMVMATCGWGLNEKTAGQLKDAGIKMLSFSLDGAGEQTHDAFRGHPGAYQMLLDAIVTANDVSLPFQINTTITKLNMDQVDEIVARAKELGAACWNPFILVPTGRGKDIADLLLGANEYEELLVKLAGMKKEGPLDLRLTCGPQFARVARQQKLSDAGKTKGCMAAAEFAFISYKGDVQTCGFLDLSAGNLVENGFDFKAIWEKSSFLESFRDPKRYTGACGDCGFLGWCRGCRARAYAVYGDVLQQDPICKLVQGRQINE